MSRWAPIWLRVILSAAGLLVLGGCVRDGIPGIPSDGVPPPGGGPGATFDLPDIPMNLPDPTIPEDDVGDGRDGNLIVDAAAVVRPNTCVELSSVAGDLLQAPGLPTPAIGDRLLLWQLQDGAAVLGDNTTLDAGNPPGGAGMWQMVSVLDGAQLQVEPAPSHAFATDVPGGAVAQVCSVPQYQAVTLNSGGTVTADPWDGAAGGVVAFYAAGTVIVNAGAVIDANGLGFRGGLVRQGSGASNITALETSNGEGGGKGESFDASGHGRSGRGNLGIGAGGGNGQNGGGGGGGHGGLGGIGGRQLDNAGPEMNTRGLGGVAFAFPVGERLSFGGGAGAGQHDNNNGGAGGAGGGVVLMFVDALANGGTVRAEGDSGEDSFAGAADGAGGGGAGGLIWIHAGVSTFNGTISVNGGRGGDVDLDNNRHGPGGGGGGGRIRLVNLAGASLSFDGGRSGEYIPDSDNWFSADGDTGVAEILP